jgi:spore coat protein A
MGMNMHALKGADGTPLGIGITAPAEGKNASVTYVTVAKRFTDMTYLFFQKDSWAVWKILDLTPDTHPFHIHLVQFQALKRTVWTPSPAPAGKMATEYDFSKVPVTDLAVDKNEKGWKDTVRANPGDRKGDDIYTAQLIEVAAQFSPYAGKYMYHCHILEHEDLEMMRPYVVVPAAMMPKANSMVGMGSM